MSLSNIITGSPWNLGNTSITIKDLITEKINGATYPVAPSSFTDILPTVNSTYNIGSVPYKWFSGYIKNVYSDFVVAGTPARSGSAFLTVGNTSDDKGIRLLNNKAGYLPSDLNSYSELNQGVTWTSQQSVSSGTVTNLMTRIGDRIFITLGGFQITDANSANFTMGPAIPAIWRPITEVNFAVALTSDDTVKIGYIKVTTAGEIVLYYKPPELSAGGFNGLLGTSINYVAAI